MTTVNVSDWSKRNCWRLPSGELAVRPGLRLLFEAESDRFFTAAFTIKNSINGEVFHYIVDVNRTGPKGPDLTIYDENFAQLVVYAPLTNRTPRGVSYAIVQDNVVVTSPDFDPMWGIIGSALTPMSVVPSEDTSLTAITVPRSICTSWVGSRVVYAAGRSIFVSDPVTALGGDPRTVVDRNQMNLDGIVYGIHEAGNGMLVAVTDEGVYGLDAAAASVGIIGEGAADWRLLNHHCVSGYDQSCVVRGRVYALTRRGYKLVDTENDDEVILSEPDMTMGVGAGRYALSDFRQARMLSGEDGPIVAVDSLGAFVMTDVATGGLRSWWKNPQSSVEASAVGLLYDVDGTQMIVGQTGVFAVGGDFDGAVALSPALSPTIGSLRGRVPTPPVMNPNARHIAYAAAVGDENEIVCAVRGSLETQAPATDTNGLQFGASSWGQAGLRYTVTPLASATFDFDDSPTNDVTIEVGAEGCLARLDTALDVDFGESAVIRPQNKPR